MIRRIPRIRLNIAAGVLYLSSTPPSWIAELRKACKNVETSISYDIKIFDELSWYRKKFQFDETSWDPARMSSIMKQRLCLGDEDAQYTVIGEAFPFPDREDSPVVNEPQNMCRLLWDHNSPTEKILIQLSDHFPPLLWHSVKPTHDALKRVFGEFLEVDAEHMKRHLPYYEKVQNSIEERMKESLCDTLSPSHIKNQFTDDMRKRDPATIELEYPNQHHIFFGTLPHFRLLEDKLMKSNAFVFGWPLLLSEGNEHLYDTPLRMAVFRTIFSKSLLLLHTRLDLQVDHRQTKLPGDEHETIPIDTPVFCTINYPKNNRMCGGSALVQRYNQTMRTSFPLDTPVDILATFASESAVKGEKELLAELKFLTVAAEKTPDVERVFRLSEDSLSSNRIIGQLAYTIIYLALVEYSHFEMEVFDVYSQHRSDLIRVACAKAAHILNRQDLVQKVIDREPEGRSKGMLEVTLKTPMGS